LVSIGLPVFNGERFVEYARAVPNRRWNVPKNGKDPPHIRRAKG
jgi:hypothetical protein